MTVYCSLLTVPRDTHPAGQQRVSAGRLQADLAAQGYVTQPEANSLLLTAAGRQARPPVDPEAREALLSSLITAVAAAAGQKDQTALRQLRPHVQTITDAALPAADPDTIGVIHLIINLRRQLAQTA